MVTLRTMTPEDWPQVSAIYRHGMDTGIATFERVVPAYEQWDAAHLSVGRIVAVDENEVAGWTALSPVSARSAYAGVAEVSIYVSPRHHRKGIGAMLLNALADESEKSGIWMLQSCVFQGNEQSLALHKKCGFRVVGYREKHARNHAGSWQNTWLLERRSPTVI